LFEATVGSTLDFGVGIPTKNELVQLGRIWNFMSPVSTTMTKLLTFGGGASLLGIGAIDAQLFASMSHNQSQSKLKAEMRTLDNFPATLVVGDKYPIITQQYIGDGGAATDNRFSPPPTIQFEDLGLTLKITPRVHSFAEVSLDIESEFKVLTGQSLNGIPVISTRKYQGKVRLHEGEWGIVAGLVTMSDTNTRGGIPIVSAIPGIGSRTKESRRGQTLLVIRPRLVTPPTSETVLAPLWLGPEAKMRTLF
jgi:general secretion pathway protein D